MTDTSSVMPVAADTVGSWAHETDVVVVGLGCAGASAALGATEVGADVTVLERASAGGGASAMAGGVIYLGGGTPIQKACGFDDTPEEMFKFLMAACGPDVDEAKVAPYCERSVDHYHWLVDHDIPFKATFYADPVYEVLTDDGLMYSGGEEAWPFCDIAKPAPRGHFPRIEQRSGVKLMQGLLDSLGRTGADIRFDTGAARLIVGRDGTVVGVVARQFGEEVAIRARSGVILAAGGFVFKDRKSHV